VRVRACLRQPRRAWRQLGRCTALRDCAACCDSVPAAVCACARCGLGWLQRWPCSSRQRTLAARVGAAHEQRSGCSRRPHTHTSAQHPHSAVPALLLSRSSDYCSCTRRLPLSFFWGGGAQHPHSTAPALLLLHQTAAPEVFLGRGGGWLALCGCRRLPPSLDAWHSRVCACARAPLQEHAQLHTHALSRPAGWCQGCLLWHACGVIHAGLHPE
jgi:hypothetical protein